MSNANELRQHGGQWHARIKDHLTSSAEVQHRTAEVAVESIFEAVQLLVASLRSNNKILICGNGGSAADAQHIAAEFMNRLRGDFDRPGLAAIALTTDTSFLTSYANDIGYEGVFERQVLALGQANDVLIAISTSGNSANVVKAVHAARKKKLKTIALCGEGGTLTTLVDSAVVVPSRDTQHIQETLLAIEHIICAAVEEILFPPS